MFSSKDSRSICFCFCVYNDLDLATRLVNQVRYFYPSSTILCVADGACNAEFIEYCQARGVKYVQGDRLKISEKGGAWLKRLFQVVLDHSNQPTIIKLDPDSFMLRRFQSFPETADIAGNLVSKSKRTITNGGCRFFRREAIEKIVKSQLLEDPLYTKKYGFSYQRFKAPYLQSGETVSEERISSEDQILGDVASRLNLVVIEWSEVNCLLNLRPSQDGYAVVHPVKTLTNDCSRTN